MGKAHRIPVQAEPLILSGQMMIFLVSGAVFGVRTANTGGSAAGLSFSFPNNGHSNCDGQYQDSQDEDNNIGRGHTDSP